MTNLTDAIDHLVEANASLRKSRALAKLERQLERALATAFRKQGRLLVKRFARLAPRFPPALREVAEPDWLPILNEVILETTDAFQSPLGAFTGRALESGMVGAIADLGVDTSFDLKHPAAVQFLAERGAESVPGINETTRNQLRTILAQAADEGWSYDRTAKAIIARFDQYGARPDRNYRNIRTRAHAIAIYELGNAYEHGNMLVAKDLQGAGLTMEKEWLSVGDQRVRPEHRANQGQGWIPLDDKFQDGSERPPTDPGCRCTVLMRRKPDA